MAGARRTSAGRATPGPLSVAPGTDGAGGPDAKEPWWLPAHDVTISDSWSPDPETVKIGENTRRVVTIEAQGMVAEGLPPRPVMRTRGILTFAGPVTRETLITPAGPVARATYRWDVKPGVPEVIPLDAITIPWFDTRTRTMREAEIPARQIGGGLPDRDDGPAAPGMSSSLAVTVAGCAAFGLGLALIGLGTRAPRLRPSGRDRRSLHRAARADDPEAFRAALAEATRNAPELAGIWAAQPAIVSGLASLDRAVYAPGRGTPPNLRDLARALSRGARLSPSIGRGRLKPLDGPI